MKHSRNYFKALAFLLMLTSSVTLCRKCKKFKRNVCVCKKLTASNLLIKNNTTICGALNVNGPINGVPFPDSTSNCECSNGCLVGDVQAFFNVDLYPPNTPATGDSENFGPIIATGWNISTSSLLTLTLYNKNFGDGSGEQGIGIYGATDPNPNPANEITETNFVQLDISAILATDPAPQYIGLTIQSIQENEGFKIYKSSTPGVLGTFVEQFVSSASDPDTKTVVVAISKDFPYINITATPAIAPDPSDILLSTVVIPQCAEIKSPILLVVDESITDVDTITGNFVGQLAFFSGLASGDKVRGWSGTAWVE
ncbi:hypothetical protein ACFLYU_01895 [Candidatus Dependentiae bacterium]